MQPNYYNLIRDEFLEPAGLISKELTFGLEIRTPSGVARLTRVYENENDELHYPRYGFIYENSTGIFESDNFWADCKIIGHPYDLREVMIYLSRGNSRNFWLQSSGELFDDSFGTESVFQFNLSKPLKDQDLKELYNLMVEVSK